MKRYLVTTREKSNCVIVWAKNKREARHISIRYDIMHHYAMKKKFSGHCPFAGLEVDELTTSEDKQLSGEEAFKYFDA